MTSINRPTWAQMKGVPVLGLILVLATSLSACGSSNSSSPSPSATTSSGSAKTVTVKAPAEIAKSGITVCSDLVEPPFIYRTTSGQLTGSEHAIITDVANLMGAKVGFVQVGFDGLFEALNTGKCNVAIDEISDTAPREKAVSFVDYMDVGQTFLVTKGNPLHINNFTDLCGHAAGGVLASTDLAYLYIVSKQCVAKGKKPITVQGFRDDPSGVVAVASGKIDAFEEDTPLVAGLVAQHTGSLQMSSQPSVKRIPVGFAVRTNDTALQLALTKAMNDLYANGTMSRIFSKFHQPGVALSGSHPVTVNMVAKGR
jgi:polar amino acid transport system substrate-binding protein